MTIRFLNGAAGTNKKTNKCLPLIPCSKQTYNLQHLLFILVRKVIILHSSQIISNYPKLLLTNNCCCCM